MYPVFKVLTYVANVCSLCLHPVAQSTNLYIIRCPMVEMRRIELLTPCVQGKCSPS